MKKEKEKDVNVKLFNPEILYEIDDLIEILQEKEVSVLVNLKYYTDKETIPEIMNYISSCQTSYATLRVKKISKKVFVCWSEHIDF